MVLNEEQIQENIDRIKIFFDLIDLKGERQILKDLPEDSFVLTLCEYFGFGAVMDSAARQWRSRNEGGAFLIGGCVITAQKAAESFRELIKQIECLLEDKR